MNTEILLEKRIMEVAFFLQKISKEDNQKNLKYLLAIVFNVLTPMVGSLKKIKAVDHGDELKWLEEIEKAVLDEVKEFFDGQREGLARDRAQVTVNLNEKLN